METIRQILEFIAPKMSVRTMDIVTYSVFAGVWVVVTVLAALGIHRLAKNKGIGRLWRAYVPFYNLVVLGEVVGSAPVFRKKIKNIGLVCMILQILFVLDLVFNEISFVYNDVLGFYVEKVQKVGDVEMIILAPHGIGVVYTIFSTILSLATLIFSFGLYLEVFRSYVPTAAMPICIVTIFFSPVAVCTFSANVRSSGVLLCTVVQYLSKSKYVYSYALLSINNSFGNFVPYPANEQESFVAYESVTL